MSITATNYRSVFDVIGPVMIGPSSSHTAGAVAIGQAGNKLLGGILDSADIYYYESFARTHQGHGTDYAIVGGLMGFATDDLRVPKALTIAKNKGIKVTFHEESGDSPIDHPNTAICVLKKADREIKLSACSVGGGVIEVRDILMDGFHVKPSGHLPMLLVIQADKKPNQTFVNEIKQTYQVNHDAVYTDSGASILYEFDLENKLKEAELENLKKNGRRIYYL